ncbi:hypothetical protein ACWDSL_40985 [Streptomyces sp. NPDC000941]
MSDDYPFHEPFSPEYVRPTPADCPNCGCCTARLCAKGRTSPLVCIGHVNGDTKETVAACPCSAESTPGTAAHTAKLHKSRRHPIEKPLAEDAEALLHALAEGGPAPMRLDLLRVLVAWRYVAEDDGDPTVTKFGRAYLAARDGAQ